MSSIPRPAPRGPGWDYESESVVDRLPVGAVDPAALGELCDRLQRSRCPGVARIRDITLTGDEVCLISEKPAGARLADIIYARRLPLSEIKPMVYGLVHTLIGVHAAGQVLGCIDPTHVFVDRGADVVFTGFGRCDLERLAQSSSRSPAARLCMAPEQKLSEPCGIEVDIYAVGVILYQLASELGLSDPLRPGDAPRFGALRGYLVDRVAPSEIRPNLPREWDTVILRAIHPLKEHRFRSAVDLRDAIDQLPAEAPRYDFGVGVAGDIADGGQIPEPAPATLEAADPVPELQRDAVTLTNQVLEPERDAVPATDQALEPQLNAFTVTSRGLEPEQDTVVASSQARKAADAAFTLTSHVPWQGLPRGDVATNAPEQTEGPIEVASEAVQYAQAGVQATSQAPEAEEDHTTLDSIPSMRTEDGIETHRWLTQPAQVSAEEAAPRLWHGDDGLQATVSLSEHGEEGIEDDGHAPESTELCLEPSTQVPAQKEDLAMADVRLPEQTEDEHEPVGLVPEPAEDELEAASPVRDQTEAEHEPAGLLPEPAKDEVEAASTVRGLTEVEIEPASMVAEQAEDEIEGASLAPEPTEDELAPLGVAPERAEDEIAPVGLVPGPARGAIEAAGLVPEQSDDDVEPVGLVPEHTGDEMQAASLVPVQTEDEKPAAGLVSEQAENKEMQAAGPVLEQAEDEIAAAGLVPEPAEGEIVAASLVTAQAGDEIVATSLVPEQEDDEIHAASLVPEPTADEFKAASPVLEHTDDQIEPVGLAPEPAEHELAAAGLVPARAVDEMEPVGRVPELAEDQLQGDSPVLEESEDELEPVGRIFEQGVEVPGWVGRPAIPVPAASTRRQGPRGIGGPAGHALLAPDTVRGRSSSVLRSARTLLIVSVVLAVAFIVWSTKLIRRRHAGSRAARRRARDPRTR